MHTSPLLRTIYAPFRRYLINEPQDNTVWIAVNDQPAAGRDAFGVQPNSKYGHVKFFTAAQVNPKSTDDPDTMVVNSFLIQHTMPNFPLIPVPSNFSKMSKDYKKTNGPIYARSLPFGAQIFDKNATKNGQHFMCMSFEDEQPSHQYYDTHTRRRWRQLDYDKNRMPEYLSGTGYHFAKILHYLKVTHSAVVGTNFSPFIDNFAIYHRYLNIFHSWGPDDGYITNSMARLLDRPLTNHDSDHLCPMWSSYHRVKVNSRGEAYQATKAQAKWLSIRTLSDLSSAPCQVWDPNNPTGNNGHLCLASAKMHTTSRQYPLTGLLMMKNRVVPLAPFDDMIAHLVVPLQDRQVRGVIEDEPKRTMKMGLIVQSWIDFATIPEMTQKLLPIESGLQVSVTIDNSQGLMIPSEDHANSYWMKATKDHSKWAVAVPRGNVGTFPKLFCLSDLNRTIKHVDDPGRGGACLCFSAGPLADLILSLQPSLDKTKARAKYASMQHLYTGFQQSLATVVQYSRDRSKMVLAEHIKEMQMQVSFLSNPFRQVTPAGLEVAALPAINTHLVAPVGVEGLGKNTYLLFSGSLQYTEFAALKGVDLPSHFLSKETSFVSGNPSPIDRCPIKVTKLEIGQKFFFSVQQAYQQAKGMLYDATVKWFKDNSDYVEKETEAVLEKEKPATALKQGAKIVGTKK